MRRRWAVTVAITAAATIASAALVLAATGPARRAGPTAAASAVTAPTDPPQAVASRPGAPGACPNGGLEWAATTFTATPVDPAGYEWLIETAGRVTNTSGAAIVVGEGVGRVARTDAPGRDWSPVLDLSLTPSGSVTLQAGRTEPYQAAVLARSASRPRYLGPGLAQAGWAVPALAGGCPAPAGAASQPGSPSSVD